MLCFALCDARCCTSLAACPARFAAVHVHAALHLTPFPAPRPPSSLMPPMAAAAGQSRPRPQIGPAAFSQACCGTCTTSRVSARVNLQLLFLKFKLEILGAVRSTRRRRACSLQAAAAAASDRAPRPAFLHRQARVARARGALAAAARKPSARLVAAARFRWVAAAGARGSHPLAAA